MNTGVLVIATAIPVVMFALWKEYFEQDWNHPENPERESEGALEGAIARIRLAGLMTTVLQLVIFMATSKIRQDDPIAGVAGLWITLAGLVGQRIQQASLEQRILRSQAGEAQSAQRPAVMSGQVLWAFAGLVIYLGLLAGALLVTAIGIAVFKWTGWKASFALAFGTLTGYSLALASNFIFSPWLMKKVLPGRLLNEGPTFELIQVCSKRAGIEPPEVRVFEQSPTLLTAWVAGLSRLPGSKTGFKGFLRPVLWITPAALEHLEKPELEAVLKHEMIHLKKNHLFQRFALAWAMSLLVLITLTGALALSAWLPEEQAGPILPAFSIFFAVALVWGSTKAIQEQSKLHEMEADLLSVTDLGARASALISALKKAERLNGAAIAKSHPDLKARIMALEPLAQRELQEHREADPQREAA